MNQMVEKKVFMDLKCLVNNPELYYGKIMLMLAGAFLLGRLSKRW